MPYAIRLYISVYTNTSIRSEIASSLIVIGIYLAWLGNPTQTHHTKRRWIRRRRVQFWQKHIDEKVQWKNRYSEYKTKNETTLTIYYIWRDENMNFTKPIEKRQETKEEVKNEFASSSVSLSFHDSNAAFRLYRFQVLCNSY